jgi:hypothetical protein
MRQAGRGATTPALAVVGDEPILSGLSTTLSPPVEILSSTAPAACPCFSAALAHPLELEFPSGFAKRTRKEPETADVNGTKVSPPALPAPRSLPKGFRRSR